MDGCFLRLPALLALAAPPPLPLLLLALLLVGPPPASTTLRRPAHISSRQLSSITSSSPRVWRISTLRKKMALRATQ
jgi:hypothetical protein